MSFARGATPPVEVVTPLANCFARRDFTAGRSAIKGCAMAGRHAYCDDLGAGGDEPQCTSSTSKRCGDDHRGKSELLRH
jgi:hypothetical protein